MKISLNWVKEYVKIDLPTRELVDLIGSRLVEVESAKDISPKYKGIKIVEVRTSEKVEGSDHLSKCMIWDGAEEHQVVCGAPNVRPGMLAVWLSPGMTVPATFDKEPFVLARRKLMGVESSGMLAGADELDFGDDHSGIVEIDPETARPGDLLSDLFNLDDIILDIENKSLTHRPDCFGIIGFAREVAGILGQPFKNPDFFKDIAETTNNPELELKVSIADPGLCSRYIALVARLSDRKSPKFLSKSDTLLARSEMRPIDPVVDLTNYLMLLTGQPLHAFDYDKLVAVASGKTPEIIVRAAKNGEELTLLDGKTIKMVESDIVITNNDIPVALAGAMGGLNTAIDKDTRRIIVESATFSLYNLRKTQMAHGIFSEAITRFTKGQPAALASPTLCEFARLAAPYLNPLAIFESYPAPQKTSVVEITPDEINRLLGTDYSESQIFTTLENVGFRMKNELEGEKTEGRLLCEAPFWRTDIHIKEDIIEEVGRLLGYDNITPSLPTRPAKGAHLDPLLALKSKIRSTLSRDLSTNEILTYSFVPARLLESAGQDPKNSYKIINSLSPDLEYFRQSLTPSLLEKLGSNLKSGYRDFALYELNKVTYKSDGLNEESVPLEKNNLALVSTGDYFEAKYRLEYLLRTLGVTPELSPITKNSPISAPFESKRSAEVKDVTSGAIIGVVGEYKNSVRTNLKVDTAAGFELNLDVIDGLSNIVTTRSVLSRYPSVERDLTFRVAADLPYEKLKNILFDSLERGKLIFDLHPLSIYQGTDTATKNISFRLRFSSPDKTLESAEIRVIMDQIGERAKSRLGAELI